MNKQRLKPLGVLFKSSRKQLSVVHTYIVMVFKASAHVQGEPASTDKRNLKICVKRRIIKILPTRTQCLGNPSRFANFNRVLLATLPGLNVCTYGWPPGTRIPAPPQGTQHIHVTEIINHKPSLTL